VLYKLIKMTETTKTGITTKEEVDPEDKDLKYCVKKLNEAVGILKGTNTPEEIQLATKRVIYYTNLYGRCKKHYGVDN